jgi:hypothetical protein
MDQKLDDGNLNMAFQRYSRHVEERAEEAMTGTIIGHTYLVDYGLC